jgi:microcystin-dependent protein
MARAKVPLTVLGADGRPLAGASVAIRRRSDNVLATVYEVETESNTATLANPLTTDAQGRVGGWVSRGAYNAVVSATGLQTYTEAFEASPGGDASIDEPWIGTGAVALRALLDAALPLGVILAYAPATPPTGWLACDGAAVSRTTYAALFAKIGTTYGPGDNSTTFGLPDLRGRSPIGAGQGAGLTNRVRGSAFGAESHPLTPGETAIRNHTHADTLNFVDNGHAHTQRPHNVAGADFSPPFVNKHGWGINANVGFAGDGNAKEYQVAGGDTYGGQAQIVKSGGVGNPNGGESNGNAHPNVHPVLAVGFIIRAL